MKRKSRDNKGNTPLDFLKVKAVGYLKETLAFITRQAFLAVRKLNAKSGPKNGMHRRRRLELEEEVVTMEALHDFRVRKLLGAKSCREIFDIMLHATKDANWERHFDEGMKKQYQAITTAAENFYPKMYNPNTTIGRRILKRRANAFYKTAAEHNATM